MRASASLAFACRWVGVVFVLLLGSVAQAQITPMGDAYTNAAAPTANYGSKPLLDVDRATQTAYIQFNLASIPAGASVSQATLKLFVDSVTNPGSFNVNYVSGPWLEGAITHELAPAMGTTIVANVAITGEDKNQYILINITPAVQAWLNGTEPNNGIALVANGAFHAAFDSKENAGTAHPPQLDIVFAAGSSLQLGTNNLICVNSSGAAATTSGSSFAGDAIIGSSPLNIGIHCSPVGGGGGGNGIVTSVGLTAPSADFIVTGSPVTASGTLGLGWVVSPDYNNTASAIVKRDSSGNFSAGSITAQAITVEMPNDGATGTTRNYLAKLVGGNAIIATTSDTSGLVGVVTGGAGITGSAQIAQAGQVSIAFDGPTTAGDYVIPSTTIGGAGHDAGNIYPTSAQVIGRVLSTNGAAGNYPVLVAAGAQAPNCPAGQTKCGGACVSTNADNANCGACGNMCAWGQTCFSGACIVSCPAGQNNCTGACTNLHNDNANCGACGTTCAVGQTCSSGACALICPAGQTACSGACTNLRNDNANCGACGVACAASQTCSSGTCAVICPAGQNNCTGACVNLHNDNANCGACGATCASGQTCSSGACTLICPAGQTACSGACVNLHNDNANCGACGTVCAWGQTCSSGTCAVICPAGQTNCNGACTNVRNDNANCGACGTACAAGQTCSSGTCALICPAGQTACSGACTNLRSDNGNCGACGNTCATGTACYSGSCNAI